MDPYRLPTSIVPNRYDLRLEPNLERATFGGYETVALEVREPAEEVVLNAAELEILTAELEDARGGRWPCEPRLDAEHERLHLRPKAPLTPGSWLLTLAFRGTLSDRLRGFYRSTHTDSTGRERTLAATMFESTDARRAFPCWDEPSFKAVFGVTLSVDPALAALANTEVVSETLVDGRRVVRFADSMRMSSYLVAFAVGDLEVPPAARVGSTPTRVIATPGKSHLRHFAEAIGAHSLAYFEDYFGLPYPGDKLDHLALPDFAMGAMENLGLITYRDAALLLDEQTSSLAERAYVADVVAHEISHMWFGDLVTMAWWNGTWLNEAFATFMAVKAVDAWKPEWDRWTEFGISRALALTTDGLHHTRPIEFPVTSPVDAEAMFDVLTYEKGGSVLRMLEQHIGETTFRDGVRAYLKRHAYANAETHDLWRALGEVAGAGVPEMMEGWVFQPGYPLIEVRRAPGGLAVNQRRFTYLPAEQRPSDAPPPGQRWSVPLQIRIHSSNGSTTVRPLLEASEMVVPAAEQAWSLVNAAGHGFYRVRYAPELFAEVVAHLDELSPLERFNLVDDAWALTQAGLLPIADLLDLTQHYQTETDRNVWAAVLRVLTRLRRLIEEDQAPQFAALVRQQLEPALARLGYLARQGEDELTRQLRGELLHSVGTDGESEEVQRWAEDYYAEFFAGPALDADLWRAALSIRAHTGDDLVFDEILARYRSHADPQERRRARSALVGFREESLVRRNLAATLDGGYRVQDAPLQVMALMVQPHSRGEAWQHLRDHWPEMEQKYARFQAHRIWESTEGLNRPKWEAEVREHLSRLHLDLGGMVLQQILERLRVAVALYERESAPLRAYLNRHFPT